MMNHKQVVIVSVSIILLLFLRSGISIPCPYDSHPRETPDYVEPMRAVGYFVRSFSGDCNADTLYWLTSDYLPEYRYYFNSFFYSYDRVWDYTSSSVVGYMFFDPDYLLPPPDHTLPDCLTWDWVYPVGADAFDVSVILTHGSLLPDAVGDPAGNVIWMGENVPVREGVNCCWPSPTWNIGLGDDRSKVLITNACHSAQIALWENGELNSLRKHNIFNTYNAQHGRGRVSEHEANEFGRYFKTTQWEDIGADWVKRITNLGTIPDVCGVSIIWGASVGELNWQSYHGGFDDLKATGSGYWGYYYIGGCDPSDGREL